MAGKGSKVVTLRSEPISFFSVDASIIDEYGKLDTELAVFKPKIERRDQLRAQIQSWYASEDGAASFVAEGNEYSLRISPREFVRKIISITEIKARLGLKRFLENCSFALGQLDKIIPADEQTSLVSKERTGNRTIKAIRKYSGDAAA